MSAPRLEIDLAKLDHNARALVERLAPSGIAVTGVTKATLGSPELAGILIGAGVSGLGDSRIENIEAMRAAGVKASMTLLRSPMPSQVMRVVASADVSFNTEPEVIARLSEAAGRLGRTHQIVLMVELGDLREGIMPADLVGVVRGLLQLPHLTLAGIGTNLACRSGVEPDAEKMAELSALAGSVEASFGVRLATVSGGNSANLGWALSGGDVGRVNDLRLGEAILLGREPLHRTPIHGLYTDAISLVAEVIESKAKPSLPWGAISQAAFGGVVPARNRGTVIQTIVAIGHQDVDPSGLTPTPGTHIAGASSDHLVVESENVVPPGTRLSFGMNYSALVRAMTSPFVDRRFVSPGSS